MIRRNWLAVLSIMLGMAEEQPASSGPHEEENPEAQEGNEQPNHPSESRITWVDRPVQQAEPGPPQRGARPARPTRPPRRRQAPQEARQPRLSPTPPETPLANRTGNKRIEWEGRQAGGLPDLAKLVGIEDAFEHTPLEPGECIAYCQYDRVAYHLSTWEFLRKENGGRCCSCGRSGTIVMLTLPGKAAESSIPVPEYLPAWQGEAQEIIGLEEVHAFVGRAVVVEAQVYAVYKTMNTGTYFVRLEERQPGAAPFAGFKLVIFPGYEYYWTRAGLSPLMYAGRRIRVRGLIQVHPTWGIEILVNSPRLIQIVDQAPDSYNG